MIAKDHNDDYSIEGTRKELKRQLFKHKFTKFDRIRRYFSTLDLP